MAPAAIAKAMGVHGGIEEEVPDFFADGGFLALLFLPIDVHAMHDGKDFVWLQNNTANKHRRGQNCATRRRDCVRRGGGAGGHPNDNF